MDTKDKQLPVSNQTEIIEIDQRLRNVEQIVDVVKHVSDKAVDSWGKYLEQKTQQAGKESALADSQHKRSAGVLVYVVSLVFVLCVLSLLKEQYELVKLIIGSSLAVGAGVGLQGIFKGKHSEKLRSCRQYPLNNPGLPVRLASLSLLSFLTMRAFSPNAE